MRLTETSLIVSWCSADHGLIKTVAKGALRPASAFAGRLDLFLTADLAYAESRRSDLHVLREASVTSHRFTLRESWQRVLAASWFVRLLEHVAERATPIPEHFSLLTRALDFLESRDPDLRAVLHYEREMARLLGLHRAHTAAWPALQQTFHIPPADRDKLLQALPPIP